MPCSSSSITQRAFAVRCGENAEMCAGMIFYLFLSVSHSLSEHGERSRKAASVMFFRHPSFSLSPEMIAHSLSRREEEWGPCEDLASAGRRVNMPPPTYSLAWTPRLSNSLQLLSPRKTPREAGAISQSQGEKWVFEKWSQFSGRKRLVRKSNPKSTMPSEWGEGKSHIDFCH